MRNRALDEALTEQVLARSERVCCQITAVLQAKLGCVCERGSDVLGDQYSRNAEHIDVKLAAAAWHDHGSLTILSTLLCTFVLLWLRMRCDSFPRLSSFYQDWSRAASSERAGGERWLQ